MASRAIHDRCFSTIADVNDSLERPLSEPSIPSELIQSRLREQRANKTKLNVLCSEVRAAFRDDENHRCRISLLRNLGTKLEQVQAQITSIEKIRAQLLSEKMECLFQEPSITQEQIEGLRDEIASVAKDTDRNDQELNARVQALHTNLDVNCRRLALSRRQEESCSELVSNVIAENNDIFWQNTARDLSIQIADRSLTADPKDIEQARKVLADYIGENQAIDRRHAEEFEKSLRKVPPEPELPSQATNLAEYKKSCKNYFKSLKYSCPTSMNYGSQGILPLEELQMQIDKDAGRTITLAVDDTYCDSKRDATHICSTLHTSLVNAGMEAEACKILQNMHQGGWEFISKEVMTKFSNEQLGISVRPSQPLMSRFTSADGQLRITMPWIVVRTTNPDEPLITINTMLRVDYSKPGYPLNGAAYLTLKQEGEITF